MTGPEYTAAEIAAEIEGWTAEAAVRRARARELRLTAERLCRYAGENIEESNAVDEKADAAEAQVRAWRATADGAA